MTFQIGEKVVYPNQGVGTIENISTRTFGAAFEKFYLLRFGCSMTVLVPLSNAANAWQPNVLAASSAYSSAETCNLHGLACICRFLLTNALTQLAAC